MIRRMIFATAVLIPTCALAQSHADDEAQAKRLFVEMASQYHASSCSVFALLQDAVRFAVDPAVPDLDQDLEQCLDELTVISDLYGRILTDYPDTEAAFEAAKSPFLSPADIAAIRAALGELGEHEPDANALDRLLPRESSN